MVSQQVNETTLKNIKKKNLKHLNIKTHAGI